MGADATELGQSAAGAADLGTDVGPHRRGEWTQLLDAMPAVGDGLQGWRRQRSLAAVVEIMLILKCWTEIAEGVAVCVGQGGMSRGSWLHREGTCQRSIAAWCAL